MQDSVAIIDMGTNTFHLLIAEWRGSYCQFIHQEKQAVKIGAGGINQGIITDAAIERAVETLKQFAITIQKFHVKKTRVFGTSALRSAVNADKIIDRIKKETGLEVQIISGEQEAEYIYLGVRSAMNLGKEKSLIIDIGGGSVEFIIGNEDEIFWQKSFDIGGQRLLEKFHRHDPILRSEMHNLNTHFEETLPQFLKALADHNPLTLVGSSGTFDTLSEMHCAQHNLPWNPEASETPLTFESLHDIFSQLIVRNRTERMKMKGMIDMRVDMIVVASCLIQYILAHHHFENIRVSSYSLKEGVLASLKI